MIAKIIAWGPTAPRRWRRLRRALDGDDGRDRRRGDQQAASSSTCSAGPRWSHGTADTGWIDRLGAEGGFTSDRDADVALIAAAIDADESEEAVERRGFYATARRGRPKARHEIVRMVDLKLPRRVVSPQGRSHRSRPLPGHDAGRRSSTWTSIGWGGSSRASS